MTATIRRPGSGDLAALAVFFAGLSMRTRIQRFFAPVRPTPAMIRLACGRTRRPDSTPPAGGTGPAGHTDALVATHGGVIIGHAMAADRPALAVTAADRPAPPGGLVTEIGVVVADAWQGQGVGSALVRSLLSRGQARGVTALSMDVLPGNREVLAMIAGHWTASRTDRSADCVTIQVGLSPEHPARPHPAPAPDSRRNRQRELAHRG